MVTNPIPPTFCYFTTFQNYQNIGFQFNITSIDLQDLQGRSSLGWSWMVLQMGYIDLHIHERLRSLLVLEEYFGKITRRGFSAYSQNLENMLEMRCSITQSLNGAINAITQEELWILIHKILYSLGPYFPRVTSVFSVYCIIMPHIHICVSEGVVVNGSVNGLQFAWCQCITWANVDSLFISPAGTNSSENLIKIKILNSSKWICKSLQMSAILYRF